METQSAHENAARLKMVLLLLLAAALAWSAFSLYRLGAGIWELLLPALAGAQGSAQGDPWAALAEVEGASWVSMIVWIAVLPVLGKCLLILFKAPWGKDFSWSDGQWMDTDPMALRPGSSLPLAEPLKESMSGYKIGMAVLGAIALLVVVAAAGSIDMPADGASLPPLDLVPLFVALLFASFVGYACAAIFTRRVQFDDAGLCDANFFRSQRVAWSAIKSIDSASGAALAAGPPGAVRATPGDWLLRDTQGRTVLRLDQNMAPQESFEALRRRVVSSSSPSGFGFLDIEAATATTEGSYPPSRARAAELANAPRQSDLATPASQSKRTKEAKRANEEKPANSVHASSASAPKKKRQWTEQEKEAAREASRKSSGARARPEPDRMAKPVSVAQRPKRNLAIYVVISAALTLFLLVIPAASSTYRALWFSFAAERVLGVVVEISPDDVPVLVVEYREVNTSSVGPQRLQSYGSDLYADYRVGDKVGVLYDPVLPGMGARLDLFLELWFGAIFLWIAALVGAAVTRSIAKGLTARRGA